jgi:protoheme IX farnesyltransferase
MLPLTDGIEKTKVYILVYSLLMLPVIILPYAISFSGLIYLIPAVVLTTYYNFICYHLYKYKKNKFALRQAKKVFGYSILYLFLIFVLFLIDNLI